MKTKSIRIKNFFSSSFKSFSLHDNVRSIPKLFDGLKESQRKALYGMILRGENAGEGTVERIAAKIASDTSYHHGTTSMESTIINMAADYTGSNNMNLFIPSGQFGSRLSKESASARYVMTTLSDNFRKLFKKEDENILKYNISENGDEIEPEVYYPILPLVLINGADGTGTGHASFIMSYNPLDIKDLILKYLNKVEVKKGNLIPWYKGFTGKIEKNKETNQISCYGKLEKLNNSIIRIYELPIGVFLDGYKDVLNSLEDEGFIKTYDDKSTDLEFEFIVKVPRSTYDLDEDTLIQKFKLISKNTENFTVWNEHNLLERFEYPEDIVERFTSLRVDIYEKRRQKMLEDLREKIRFNEEKLRFISFYLNNTNVFKSKKKEDLIKLLLENKFNDYDKLLSLPIWNLTFDKIEELKTILNNLKAEYHKINKDNARDMYIRELNNFSYTV